MYLRQGFAAGVCDLLTKHGVSELTPYLCAVDFVESDALGPGLSQTSTLPSGGKRRDFRYGTSGPGARAGAIGRVT